MLNSRLSYHQFIKIIKKYSQNSLNHYQIKIFQEITTDKMIMKRSLNKTSTILTSFNDNTIINHHQALINYNSNQHREIRPHYAAKKKKGKS